MDPKLLRPGDVLIGFFPKSHVSVVTNVEGPEDTRSLVLAYQNNIQVTVTVKSLAEDVRVMRSRW